MGLTAVPRFAVGLGVVSLAGLAAAGCGGAAHSGPPAPGHGSPAAAATGFFRSFAADDTNAACAYVLPLQASLCDTAVSSGAVITVTHFGVGHTTVNGSQALVTVTGTICVKSSGSTGSHCTTNEDTKKGQPAAAGQAAFRSAYTKTAAAGTGGIDTVPCARSGGHWYVDLTGQ